MGGNQGIKGPTDVFCDIKSVVKNAQAWVWSLMRKQHFGICYHPSLITLQTRWTISALDDLEAKGLDVTVDCPSLHHPFTSVDNMEIWNVSVLASSLV